MPAERIQIEGGKYSRMGHGEMEIWMDDYRGIRGDKSNGKEKRRGSMKGKMVLRFGVER